MFSRIASFALASSILFTPIFANADVDVPMEEMSTYAFINGTKLYDPFIINCTDNHGNDFIIIRGYVCDEDTHLCKLTQVTG